MKKVVISVFILAAIAILGTPYLVGAKVESVLQNSVQIWNQQPGYSVSLSNLDKQRSHTSATFNISVDMAGITDDAALDPIQLRMDFHANHGPFLDAGWAWSDWSFSVYETSLAEALQLTNGVPVYSIQGETDLAGKYNFTDQVPAFESIVTDLNVQVEFTGYQGTGSYDGKTLTYQGFADTFTAEDENGKVQISGLNINSQILSSIEEVLTHQFYDSEAKIQLAEVDFVSAQNADNLNIKDFSASVSSKVQQDSGLAKMWLAYQLQELTSGEMFARDMALEMEINNISHSFYAAYQKHLTKITGLDAELTEQENKAFFKENLLTLLSAEPELNITRLSGTFAEGSFDSHFHSKLTEISALPEVIDDADFWLGHALVDGQFTGDKAVIEWLAFEFVKGQIQNNPQALGMAPEQIQEIAAQQAPMFLQNLTDQGFLELSEQSYQSKISIKDKQLTVNGQTFPLLN